MQLFRIKEDCHELWQFLFVPRRSVTPCGYVDKANRSLQAEFTCRYCGYKSHADVNGARNILVRSSDEIGSVYKNKKLVLRILVERFTGRLERDPCRCSTAKDLILRNPYFKDYWDKFKEVS